MHASCCRGPAWQTLRPPIPLSPPARLQAWADTPALTTPLLKFVAEFCFNRSQRLTFDSSSPNGILLFRCDMRGWDSEVVSRAG